MIDKLRVLGYWVFMFDTVFSNSIRLTKSGYPDAVLHFESRESMMRYITLEKMPGTNDAAWALTDAPDLGDYTVEFHKSFVKEVFKGAF